jgi:hypothetical protein
MPARVPFDHDHLDAFCRKWKVRELSLFGSILRDDFRPDSDVDVMVEFEPEAPWSLWDWPTMMDELKAIFGREVDLVEKRAIKNPFRRHHIMRHHEVVYAA